MESAYCPHPPSQINFGGVVIYFWEYMLEVVQNPETG
jgi:hypothetical protein